MAPKGFEDSLAQSLRRNPKPFIIVLLATSIAIDHFDILGNKARIAAQDTPAELKELDEVRAEAAIARSKSSSGPS